MTRSRKIAVVTTFSRKGYDQYAKRMLASWVRNWPVEVDLFVYPDERIPAIPKAPNLRQVHTTIPEKLEFIKYASARPEWKGETAKGYEYRFDAVKFSHKPFALWHCAHEILMKGDRPYSGMIWLDADTLTHSKVSLDVVENMAPRRYDIQFLGRCYKYTECGYLYFNLENPNAIELLDRWVGFYLDRTFSNQKEWHDSYLYDQARYAMGDRLIGKDLTGHIPRRKGAGHPLINSFLGRYLDHLKGNSRKATGKPRRGDLHADHDSDYWKQNPHAKETRKRHR